MARRRLPILLPLLALFALVPGVAFAAGFFGPILPQSGSCHCPSQLLGGGNLPLDWGCVLQVIQNLIQFAVSFGVILMVLWIAYAGFSLMVSGGSPEARSQGKTRIMNAIVGILVILSAWLIVDFVMKVLYEPNTAFSGGVFGPWNSILADNDGNYCIQEHTPQAITLGSVLSNITTAQPGTYTPGQIGVTRGLCPDSSTICSVSVLQSYGLTPAQAQTMSCIAVTESSGGSKKGDSGTGAQGLFQITGQNWSNPAYHSSSCSTATSRQDDACNAQAAALMLKSGLGYQPWSGICYSQRCSPTVTYGQRWNPNAYACVQKYDPNTTLRT